MFQMKTKIDLGIIEETLLITLYFRAKETQKLNGILKDEMACEIVSKIDYDFSKFDNDFLTAIGCVMRVNHFDNKARVFIDKEKNPVVVNVGCGLDTRYQRVVKDSNTIFYGIDLPDVIALRKKLIPDSINEINISSSMLDTKWMDTLKSKHPESHFIFIIEGVFMYLPEHDIKSFLNNLATRFKGSEVHFDVCGSLPLKKWLRNDSVKHTKARFIFAMDDGKIIEKWIPNMTLTNDLNYLEIDRKRWGLLGFFVGLFPSLARRMYGILGFVIK